MCRRICDMYRDAVEKFIHARTCHQNINIFYYSTYANCGWYIRQKKGQKKHNYYMI